MELNKKAQQKKEKEKEKGKEKKIIKSRSYTETKTDNNNNVEFGKRSLLQFKDLVNFIKFITVFSGIIAPPWPKF